MGSGKQESKVRKFLRSIPGMARLTPGEDQEDLGNTYEFEAKIGKKGNSLGLTFDRVSRTLGRIQEGMRARVIMVREPGSSLFTARIQFLEEEDESGS